MGIWIAIPIAILVYIITFSKDFKEEDMSKATPFIVAIIVLPIIAGLISSLGG